MRGTAVVFAALALLMWSPVSAVREQGPQASSCRGAEPDSAPAAARNSHAYYASLTSRPDCLAAYSLRSQHQIEKHRRGRNQATAVTYDPAADKDPRKQDAARILIANPKVSLPTQIRVPIPQAPDGFIITWDAWLGREFAFSNTGIGQYKAFQLASDSRIWTEVRNVFKAAGNERNARSGAVAMVDVRSYGGPSGGYMGPNVTKNQPLSPQAEKFGVMPETWTRYWVQLAPAADGFFEFSLWVADERRDPVRLHDKLLIKPTKSGNWNEFWIEYNTSSKKQPRKVGDLLAYARNIVVLHNVKNVAELLKKPEGGKPGTGG